MVESTLKIKSYLMLGSSDALKEMMLTSAQESIAPDKAISAHPKYLCFLKAMNEGLSCFLKFLIMLFHIIKKAIPAKQDKNKASRLASFLRLCFALLSISDSDLLKAPSIDSKPDLSTYQIFTSSTFKESLHSCSVSKTSKVTTKLSFFMKRISSGKFSINESVKLC